MTDVLAAIPGLLFLTLCYAALCAISPFGTCRKCRGFGFHLKTNRRGQLRRGKDCRRCDGHGKRIRLGRWLYNRASRLHDQGTR
ncbi:hypothetical protein DEH18_00700 [Streptomyces sp. NHF165]|uniref:hypothetical protein n=1 Tax=Streptomyces sp. NHF165 TaxID=2175864 RepID=UPI00132EEE5F|nr:hypothetical protein [Streptomyces sp. NHF165]QHF92670.1 hypothetical protein DEH18_00700 [Streptomyces sp. NHF165]